MMADWFTVPAMLAALLIFLGAFVQTAIGFGMAVVAAPLLYMVSPDYIPAPIMLAGLFISLLSAVKHRHNVQLGGLKIALISRIPGSILGGWMLLVVSSHTLSLWLGALVLMAVLISLLPFRVEPTPTRMGIAGFFSGLFGTSSAIGGPPMALLLQHQGADQLRGNLSAFFVLSAFLSMAVLIPTGFLTLHHLWITLPLLPAAWFGYWLARLTTHSLPQHRVRAGALILCLLSGVMAIGQGLHA